MSTEVTTELPAETRLVPARKSMPIVITQASPTASGPEGHEIAPVLHAVRRRWQISLLLGLILSGGAAIAAWTLQEPKYTAAAQLRVYANNPRLMFDTAEGYSSFAIEKSTQQQLMMSPIVLNNALSDENVANLVVVQKEDNPRGWLRDNLSVTYPGDGEIMEVSLELEDHDACVEIVNAVVDSYMSDIVEDQKTERNERLEDLKEAHEVLSKGVREQRSKLQSLAKSLSISDSQSLSIAQQGAVRDYTFWQNALSQVEWDLIQAENELVVLQSLEQATTEGQPQSTDTAASSVGDEKHGEPSPEAEEDAETATISDEELELLLGGDGEAAELQDKIERLNTLMSKNVERLTPKLAAELNQKERAKLLELESQLQERKRFVQAIANQQKQEQLDARRSAASRNQMSGTRVPGDLYGLKHEITSKQISVKNLERSRARLVNKVNELESEQSQLGGSSLEVEMLRSGIADDEDVRRNIAAEIERTQVELNSGSRVKVNSRAEIFSAPDRKKRYAITGAAAACGLFGPLCLMVLFDVRKKHVNDSRSVVDSLDTVHLGSIPRVPSRLLNQRASGNSRRYQQWQNRLLESVDAIASLLIRNSQADANQVIQISSPTAREGKSTVATQLARSLARSGRRTLLIDFDLRRPTLHSAFGFDLQPGVAEVLNQSVMLEEAIQKTAQPNLHVLTAGCRQEKLFSGSSANLIEALFQTIRQDYEFVIVDSCPVLPVVDARVVGQYVDGVILSLVKDFSKLPQAVRASEIMKSYGIRMIGTTVTGCELENDYYSGHREYLN